VHVVQYRTSKIPNDSGSFEIAPKAGTFMPANLTKAPEDQKVNSCALVCSLIGSSMITGVGEEMIVLACIKF
jgi:hypothetical protein